MQSVFYILVAINYLALTSAARLAGECAMMCNDLRTDVLTLEMCRYYLKIVWNGPVRCHLISDVTRFCFLLTQERQANSTKTKSWWFLFHSNGTRVFGCMCCAMYGSNSTTSCCTNMQVFCAKFSRFLTKPFCAIQRHTVTFCFLWTIYTHVIRPACNNAILCLEYWSCMQRSVSKFFQLNHQSCCDWNASPNCTQMVRTRIQCGFHEDSER